MTSGPTLVLGIGNVLLGDEGVGVHVVRYLESRRPAVRASLLDGGTGSFSLLGPMEDAGRLILVDATIDGRPPGTVRRLRPRFSPDYPRTLTAHDIGLKDLLDAFHLSGKPRDVTLFAVSISPDQQLGTELSDALAACVPEVAGLVLAELVEASDGQALA